MNIPRWKKRLAFRSYHRIRGYRWTGCKGVSFPEKGQVEEFRQILGRLFWIRRSYICNSTGDVTGEVPVRMWSRWSDPKISWYSKTPPRR